MYIVCNIAIVLLFLKLSLPIHVSAAYPGLATPSLSKKVRFSDDEDLTNEECHSLLQKYMPKHIQETKITQKLFIRSHDCHMTLHMICNIVTC